MGSVLYIPPGHTDAADYTLDIYAVRALGTNGNITVPEPIVLLYSLFTAIHFVDGFTDRLYNPHAGMALRPDYASRRDAFMRNNPDTGIFKRFL